MIKNLEIMSLEIHVSLQKTIVKNIQLGGVQHRDPIRRKEYQEEVEDVRGEILAIAKKIERLRDTRGDL
jgi:hypothetical protein